MDSERSRLGDEGTLLVKIDLGCSPLSLSWRDEPTFSPTLAVVLVEDRKLVKREKEKKKKEQESRGV